MLKQKRAMGRVKSVSVEDRTVEAWVTTNDLDRDGEVVEPKSFEERIGTFKANPLFLWMHQPFAAPLGKVLELEIQAEKVGALIQFRDSAEKVGTDGPSPNEALKMYADGTLTSFSIGFRVHEYKAGYRREDGTREPLRITKAELYEVSAVTVPANPKARVKLAGIEFDNAHDLLRGAQRVIEALGESRSSGEQIDPELLKVAQDLRCLMFGVPRRAEVTVDKQELKTVLDAWSSLA